ncbi:MAG: hydroxyacid dehydrogenase [Clostridia bacterium]
MDEKIAFLLDRATQKMIFNQKALNYFSSIGKISINEGGLKKDNIKKVIKNATIAVTSWGNSPLDADILSECPDLKFVAHAAGSIKPIVSDELWAKNIRVLSSACPLGEGVAETALGFTISASKNFYNLNTNVKIGGWIEGKEDIRELFDLKIGVIGAGWAGKHYIKLLQNFCVDVLLYDPFVSDSEAKELGAKKCSFKQLLKQSDIVSIHVPSIPSTYHMINSEALSLMKRDAVLINTARGTIVDELALYVHMVEGGLKYACLDVFDPEPPKPSNRLFSLANVITTPHLAGLTSNGLRRIGAFICEETAHFLENKPVKGEVTAEMLSKMA